MEEHRRLAHFQRTEQLFIGLVAEQHPLVHGIRHPASLVGHPLQQGLPVFGREVHLLAVLKAEAADAHEPCTVGHIIRAFGGLRLAAQVKDEPQPQRVQQLPVGLTGELPRRDAPVDLPPPDVLALVGLVAAQLAEVVAALERQFCAGGRMHHSGLGCRAGQDGQVVEGLGRTSAPGRQAGCAAQHLHEVAAQQVDVGRGMIPPLHQGDAEGRQILQQDIPHPVQLPPCPRLIPGQAGAELLLHEVVGLIEAGADLGVGRETRPGAGLPQRGKEVLPQAGQKDPLVPQLGQRHALPLPEGVAPRHQQAGRVGPEGGAGQHRCGAAQIHHEARVQLALLHPLGHRVVVQQAEAHLDVRVLLAELVQLGLEAGQIVRHQ